MGMMAERLLLYRGELVLANSAKWAYPIVWDVLEGCSWGNAAIRVAYCWVIYPTTYVTYIKSDGHVSEERVMLDRCCKFTILSDRFKVFLGK